MNHPMRKRYSNNGGNNGGRRNNSNRSYNNRGNNGGAPRPRKNFRALQEKFLNHAKDAMASGDRILAEYYLQHADHYYRMNEEFLAERAEYYDKRNASKKEDAEQPEASAAEESQDDTAEASADAAADFDASSSSLPSFITSGGKDVKEGNVKVVNLQEWEE